MSATPEAGKSIAVVTDGRYWSVIGAEPLPGYLGHKRAARETLAGFHVYPFTRQESAGKAADQIAREMGRKVILDATLS